MLKVFIDQSTREKLHNLSASMELYDESGQALGYFVPAGRDSRALYKWAQSEFTDAEIQSARNESGGMTIDEVAASLRES